MAQSPIRRKAEWTVAVFMNCKSLLECSMLTNFRAMAAVGSSPEVNILVEMGRRKDASTCPKLGLGPGEVWGGVRRFRVTRNMSLADPGLPRGTSSTDMGSIDHLYEFVSWCLKNYPAKRTMLILAGHGSGFRLLEFLRVSGRLKEIDPKGALEAKLAAGLIPDGNPGGMKLTNVDPVTQSTLYNRQIQDRLVPLFARKRLSIIGFDSCLMANLETAYAMRNLAQYMVASQELEPDTGWNYQGFLTELHRAPRMEADRLASQIVFSHGMFYGRKGLNTLSAIRLSRTGDLARRLSNFCAEAIPRLSTDQFAADVDRARGALVNYGLLDNYHNPIDLAGFLSSLRDGPSAGARLRDRIDKMLEALDKMVLANFASPASQNQFGSSGVSIYFPQTPACFNGDPFDEGGYDRATCGKPKTFPVEFVCRERWVDFLIAWLKTPIAKNRSSPCRTP